MRRPDGRTGERGSALLLSIFLILAITLVGVALIRQAGNDRISAAQTGVRARGQSCAEAGIQYGRRFFGAKYESTHGWNDYLNNTVPGYRYDTTLGDKPPSSVSSLPMYVRGASDGSHLDPGSDIDGDGLPDFWVSIRDDDDERPLGATDDRRHDNNETVILRSECTNAALAAEQGGLPAASVIEVVLSHVQSASGYGNAQITSNSPDIVGGN